ncbi:hypothetical protein [Synechococcus sp. M16CYN]|uniref:hypothetical protein n=1 Tax=Synechococcus sp. M16CYN TaxID=3103139 RepID=UPI0033407561
MPKPLLVSLIWLLALSISAGFRFWGKSQPLPLQAPTLVVWLFVFLPSTLLAVWLTLAPSQRVDSGARQSDLFDRESR